jgi:hypothetical protein
MITSASRIRRIAVILALACWALTVTPYTTQTASAQETAKQKGHLECWVKCCWEIGCKWVSGAGSVARKADQGAQITVNNGQLIAEFKPAGEQRVFEVKQETKLDAETAEVMGFGEITLLPGQYPLTRLENGRAKVAIKVKTAAAKGNVKAGYNLKEGKGKSKN